MANEERIAPTWLTQAMLDPGSVFASPEAVLDHPELDADQKIAILRAWEYDAAELGVAEEEGMRGAEDDLLQRILLALARLTDGRDVERVAVTKQHGLIAGSGQ